MNLYMVCPLVCRFLGPVVRFFFAVVFLLLATRTVSCANTLNPFDDDATILQMGNQSKESLIGAALFTNSSSGHAATVTVPSTEADAFDSVSRVFAAENRVPDWNGIWRDTSILFASQVVAAGIIYTMPESFSNWTAEQKKNSFKKYARNVSDPVMDEDKFYINYVLHPYWGATYYIRGRERGLDAVSSFIYSALISAMYEFGVESFAEKPSIQDLIVTPVGGAFLGAFVFEPWRESIKRKMDLRWYDHAALAVTDPVGVLSHGFEKIFGIKPAVMVDYSVPQIQRRSAGSVITSKDSRIGVVVRFPFN